MNLKNVVVFPQVSPLQAPLLSSPFSHWAYDMILVLFTNGVSLLPMKDGGWGALLSSGVQSKA